MTPWTDGELLAGMRDPTRRPEAFRALHRRYGPRLLGLLRKMCHGDQDLAEDLLGQALYKCYLALAKPPATPGAEIRSLPAWLYTVASRTALDALSLRAGDPLDTRISLEEWTPAARTEPTSLVSAEMGGRGEAAGIEAALEELLERLDREDPRYRTLLEMEHIGACDRAEMAEATGIARKQLSQYLKRARERFLKLAREYPSLASLAEPAPADHPGASP